MVSSFMSRRTVRVLTLSSVAISFCVLRLPDSFKLARSGERCKCSLLLVNSAPKSAGALENGIGVSASGRS
jgi:hypothetical protein